MDEKMLRDMDDASFYQLMLEDGRKIDPDKALLFWWTVNLADPYGRGGTEECCFDHVYFVANPGGLWVCSAEVPDDLWKRVMEIERARQDELDQMPF